jgi:hypothetical protein
MRFRPSISSPCAKRSAPASTSSSPLRPIRQCPDAKDRQATVIFAKDAWKAELPTELEFVRACTDTANKVVKSELKEAAARKYLESLI